MNTTLTPPATQSTSSRYAICSDSALRSEFGIWGRIVSTPLTRFSSDHPLAPVMGGRIRADAIQQNWDGLLRLTASLRAGSVSPSLLVSKLAAYPKHSGLAFALREIGRLERTIFTLEWLKD